MKRQHSFTISISCLIFCFGFARSDVSAQTVEWHRQLGTSGIDNGIGIHADASGNVFMAGRTTGSLQGGNAGGSDGFLSKHNSDGTLDWVRQFGTADDDVSTGISADANGNLYVSGYTSGSLGSSNEGGLDLFVTKFSSNGIQQWTRQLGTDVNDQGQAVSVDGLGNVFVSGHTWGDFAGTSNGFDDAVLTKFDTNGNVAWTRQIGTSLADRSLAVAADGTGNVFISGYTSGSIAGSSGGRDAFVSKYDSSGSVLWSRQTGSSQNDQSNGIVSDGLGNVYLTGSTFGNMDGANEGFADTFLAKYDSNGILEWTRQLGTSGRDVGYELTTDGMGNILISGQTEGSLGGPNAGSYDVFLSMYDPDGDLLWADQFGTAGFDTGLSISANGMGEFFVSGSTSGSLGGANAGSVDAFVSKFSTAVPEPSSLVIVLIGIAALSGHRRRRDA